MPEYHLPMGSFEDGRTFAALDLFTQGYVDIYLGGDGLIYLY